MRFASSEISLQIEGLAIATGRWLARRSQCCAQLPQKIGRDANVRVIAGIDQAMEVVEFALAVAD